MYIFLIHKDWTRKKLRREKLKERRKEGLGIFIPIQ
jgi:hypothetical protein